MFPRSALYRETTKEKKFTSDSDKRDLVSRQCSEQSYEERGIGACFIHGSISPFLRISSELPWPTHFHTSLLLRRQSKDQPDSSFLPLPVESAHPGGARAEDEERNESIVSHVWAVGRR